MSLINILFVYFFILIVGIFSTGFWNSREHYSIDTIIISTILNIFWPITYLLIFLGCILILIFWLGEKVGSLLIRGK